ncbi:serine--tRNA ligase [Hujiaoplasma nucleasis]|uniref:Serine--tRNA ligase n=1 Tax=Hujiaoplasma nucleasis TaxID=2725268 RepID=A0A7L6N302_9MOLU|nr:serine--tRNA ligase [Hujiaoplasma nucleasis]QLY39921.1 serine--tRNA ligase [Hujiaoplasma nucleasis]
MLNQELLLNQPELVQKALSKKGVNVSFDGFIEMRNQRVNLIQEIEAIRAKRNQLSKEIGVYKREKRDTENLFKEIENLKGSMTNQEEILKDIEDKINEFLLKLPNLPDEDLLAGDKEYNQVIYTHLEQPKFDFKVLDHVELATKLNIIDYERAAKISGKGTWIYSNIGARLEWALLNFFIDQHHKDQYEFMLMPHILNYQSGLTAGQFPKFEEDVFWLDGEDKQKFLLPTSETALINLHRNEILSENQLPRKYFSYSPCYRKEAGSYRSEERGMIRGYQFNKVEMIQFTKAEDSDKAFDEMLEKAKSLMNQLGLHYQVSKLAAGDVAFAMSRTFDIEVYLPSINIYKEVSSVSNSRDFQARRGLIRYRNSKGEIEYCHTLNGSGLATSRLVPAILEQYQQKDGSVKIPEVLVPYMGGLTEIR